MAKNQVKTLFGKLKDRFGNANANTGEGALGPWPEHGDHECVVTGVQVEQTSFNIADGVKCNAGKIQFFFRTIPNEENPDGEKALDFNGQPFVIPLDFEDIPPEHGNKKQQAEISLQRLKGHLKTMLGDNFVEDDLDFNLEQVSKILEGGTALVVEVYCEHRPGKPNPNNPTGNRPVYKTEFVKKILSS